MLSNTDHLINVLLIYGKRLFWTYTYLTLDRRYPVWCLQYRNAICLLFSLFALLTHWTSAICCNKATFTISKKMVFCFVLTIIVVNISMKYGFSNLLKFSKKKAVVAKNDEMTTIKPATVHAAVAEVSAILTRAYIAELEDTRWNFLKTRLTIRMTCGNLTALYANNHTHFKSTLTDLLFDIHSVRFHDNILAMLRRHAESVGLKTVVYGDNPAPGFHELYQLYSRAYIVVAPHGADESNLIFSQPGTILVEGICYDSRGFPNWCYRIMATALGHRYCGLMFEKQCMNISAADVEPFFKYYVRKFIS